MLNGVLGDGMSSRLFLGVREEKGLAYDVSSGIVEYADAGALEISAGVDPDQLPAAIEAILAELVRMVDDPIPDEELAKAKAYLSGGLELRMDDTRHLASWIGGQEALHDRVFTLDEALEAVEAVRSADVTAPRRRAVPRRGAADGGRGPGEAPARARAAPPAAAVTPTAGDGRADHRRGAGPPGRCAWRASISGWARCRWRARSSRRWRVAALLDEDALLDLAEARWRTGDLAGAGDGRDRRWSTEAATTPSRS